MAPGEGEKDAVPLSISCYSMGDAAMGNKGNFFSRNTMKRYVEERIILEKVEFAHFLFAHLYACLLHGNANNMSTICLK